MSRASRVALLAFAASSVACVRTVTQTEVRAREPRAVGVTVVGAGETSAALGPDRLERSPSGAIVYRYRRGPRFDASLVDERGHISAISPPRAIEDEEKAADRLVRLPLDWNKVEKEGAPPPKLDLVTTLQNVEEVQTVREPSRLIGVVAAVTGASLLAAGAIDGVDRLDDPPSSTRAGLFVVDGAFTALGATVLTLGAWYLFAPEEHAVAYRVGE